eukprot:m.844685 g.844685  ORF g.844685 m.844685 type:complete len:201 (-) comp59545_c0_seq5:3372-3974(-)
MQAEQVTGHSGARMRQRYLTHLQHRQTLQAHVASEDVVSEAGSGVSERKGRTKRSVGRPAVFTPTQSKQALHRKTTEPEEEDEVFEVEAIRDHEIRNGATFFFVKWKGYEESDNSWEPVEHLQASCVKLLAAYWKKHNEDASQEVPLSPSLFLPLFLHAIHILSVCPSSSCFPSCFSSSPSLPFFPSCFSFFLLSVLGFG